MVEIEGENLREQSTSEELMTKERSYMFEERLDMAGKLKQLGNERFQRKHVEEAAEAYQRALHHVDFDELQVNFDFNDKHRSELTAAKLPILLNLCQSLVRAGSSSRGDGDNLKRAIERANEAIELDKACAKAWFWRGKAKMDSGNLEGSGKDLEEAIKLAPGDKSVRWALQSLRMKRKEVAAARRNLWGGLFRRGDRSSHASGRQVLEEAAARAREGPKVSGGGNADGNNRQRKGGERWGFVMMAMLGAVVFAAAGVLTARYANSRRLPP